MKKRKQKQFYIICNCKLYTDQELGGSVEKPVLLYEDGTIEVQDIVQFKDYSTYKKWRHCYSYIKEKMEWLNKRDRDLRKQFVPTRLTLELSDVLALRIPLDQKSIAVSKLRKFHYERCIQNEIYDVIEGAHQKLI